MIPRRRKNKGASHLKTGLWGEKLAEKFLRKGGYKILARRVRIGKHDEIDLVARNKQTLVFIEVKTRSPEAWGRPGDAVDKGKRMRMTRAAAAYVARLKTPPSLIQFDVVEVTGTPDDPRTPVIKHLEDAFSSEGNVHVQW